MSSKAKTSTLFCNLTICGSHTLFEECLDLWLSLVGNLQSLMEPLPWISFLVAQTRVQVPRPQSSSLVREETIYSLLSVSPGLTLVGKQHLKLLLLALWDEWCLSMMAISKINLLFFMEEQPFYFKWFDKEWHH